MTVVFHICSMVFVMLWLIFCYSYSDQSVAHQLQPPQGNNPNPPLIGPKPRHPPPQTIPRVNFLTMSPALDISVLRQVCIPCFHWLRMFDLRLSTNFVNHFVDRFLFYLLQVANAYMLCVQWSKLPSETDIQLGTFIHFPAANT